MAGARQPCREVLHPQPAGGSGGVAIVRGGRNKAAIGVIAVPWAMEPWSLDQHTADSESVPTGHWHYTCTLRNKIFIEVKGAHANVTMDTAML